MRNRKRRALVVAPALVLAFGLGLWLGRERVQGEVDPRAAPDAPSWSAPVPHGAGAVAKPSAHAATEQPDPGGLADARTREPAPGTAEEAARVRPRALGGASGPREGRAIYLRAGAPPPGMLSSAIGGLDTGAPRALVLWRLEDGAPVRVAGGSSEADGSLHFPDILVPDRPLDLQVSALEEGPQGIDRSAPDVVRGGALLPPDARAKADSQGALHLRVTASRSLGAVVVADGRGAVLARIALPPIPLSGNRIVDVPIDAGAGPFLVAQELPDGRRSAWSTVSVPSSEP